MDAVSYPPHIEYLSATATGKVIFWVVFLIFAVSSIGMLFLADRKTANGSLQEKLHHYITWMIVSIAALSYLTMATNFGSTFVRSGMHPPTLRSFYYARYIDWVFTTPLLLLDLLLLGDVTFAYTLRVIFADVVMIVSGFIGSIQYGSSKWLWFLIGCIALLAILYDLMLPIRRNVFARSERHGALYGGLAPMLLVLWILYPIVWALAEGSGLISVDVEIFLYAVLDVIAKAVFGWVLIITIGKWSSRAGALEERIAATGKRVDDLGAPLVGARGGNEPPPPRNEGEPREAAP